MAASVRERLQERWDETYAHFTAENPKMVYFLSMEFLQVRSPGHKERRGGLEPRLPALLAPLTRLPHRAARC